MDDLPLIELLIIVMVVGVLGFACTDSLFTPKQARWVGAPQETPIQRRP